MITSVQVVTITTGLPAPSAIGAVAQTNAQTFTVTSTLTPAAIVQTQIVTTTSLLSGAVITSTAILPALALEQTVSLTIFSTVTAVVTERETLSFFVTSTACGDPTTNQVCSPRVELNNNTDGLAGPSGSNDHHHRDIH